MGPVESLTLRLPGLSGFELGMALVRTLVQEGGATVIEYGATAGGTEIELHMAARPTGQPVLGVDAGTRFEVFPPDRFVALEERVHESRDRASVLIRRSGQLASQNVRARGESRTLLTIARRERAMLHASRQARRLHLETSASRARA